MDFSGLRKDKDQHWFFIESDFSFSGILDVQGFFTAYHQVHWNG